MNITDPYLQNRHAYAYAFRRFAIGLIFLFDFQIYVGDIGIDILPDVIGFIIITLAARNILALHCDAVKIHRFATILTMLSVFTIIEVRVSTGTLSSTLMCLIPSLIIGILALVFIIIFVWQLCGIVADLAAYTRAVDVYKSALSRRTLYIVFIVIQFFIIFVMPNLIVLFFFIIAWIVILTMLIGLMKQAERICIYPPYLPPPPDLYPPQQPFGPYDGQYPPQY